MNPRVKMAALLAVSVILMAALLYIIMVTRIKLSIEDEAILRARAERDSIYWQIRGQQATIEQSVNSIASDTEIKTGLLEHSIDPEEFLEGYDHELLHVIWETPDIIGGYIYLDPDVFGEVHYRRYSWKNGEYVFVNDTRTAHPDYLRRSGPLLKGNESVAFYAKAVERGAGWTKGYADPILKKPVVSYVIPAYINGTLVGVAGMDVNPASLERIMAASLLTRENDLFILDTDGTYAIPPRHPDQIDTAYFRDIIKEEGVVETPTALLSYRYMDDEAYLVLVIPKHEAFSMLYELQLEFFIVTAALTVVVAGIGFIIADSTGRDPPEADGKQ